MPSTSPHTWSYKKLLDLLIFDTSHSCYLLLYNQTRFKSVQSSLSLLGSVKIPIHDLSGRHNSERWHPLDGGEVAGGASLRAKCRYQSLEVLPCRHYQPLLLFLRDNYSQLVEYLEPVIG